MLPVLSANQKSQAYRKQNVRVSDLPKKTKMSLVADYGTENDSDSENELLDETAPKACSCGKEGGFFNLNKDESQCPVCSAAKQELNTDNSHKSEHHNSLPSTTVEKLPTPALSITATSSVTASIYFDPFKEAEEVKNSILEQHVKLTAHVPVPSNTSKKKRVCYSFQKGACNYGAKCRYSHDMTTDQTQACADTEQTNSDAAVTSTRPRTTPGQERRVCYSYQKGMCKYGTKCRYSHDISTGQVSDQRNPHTNSNMVVPPAPLAVASEQQQQYMSHMNINRTMSYNSNAQDRDIIAQFNDREDNDSYMGSMKRKVRPGITDTMNPAKRSHTVLDKERAKERPWVPSTVNKSKS